MSVLLVGSDAVVYEQMGRRHHLSLPTPNQKNLSDMFSTEYQDQQNMAVRLFLCQLEHITHA